MQLLGARAHVPENTAILFLHSPTGSWQNLRLLQVSSPVEAVSSHELLPSVTPRKPGKVALAPTASPRTVAANETESFMAGVVMMFGLAVVVERWLVLCLFFMTQGCGDPPRAGNQFFGTQSNYCEILCCTATTTRYYYRSWIGRDSLFFLC